ncbi:hypothetical protein Sjap_007932 [Stephania japonica]|uniref:Uncharacterized protein n=1 Tax=Stephania japonica TaxID=461633 RepID=A0AAP0JNJ3_9MAGN
MAHDSTKTLAGADAFGSGATATETCAIDLLLGEDLLREESDDFEQKENFDLERWDGDIFLEDLEAAHKEIEEDLSTSSDGGV